MELEFRELEFQNAIIGLPKPGMGRLHFKIFFFNKCDRPIPSLESPIVAFLSPIVMF